MEPEHHETLSSSAFPALQHCAHYLPSRRARRPSTACWINSPA